MTYLQFREQWRRVGCFNIYQLRAWQNDFDRTNLSRWVKQGYLLKIRQDWYAFSDILSEPEAPRYIAYKIYQPSYISLHSALSIYGIIPEAVSRITSVTTSRTTAYSNDLGEFSYQSIKLELYFGYKQVPVAYGGFYQLALPEKAFTRNRRVSGSTPMPFIIRRERESLGSSAFNTSLPAPSKLA